MNNIPMQMQVPADLVQIQKNYLAEWKPAPRPWHSNATLQAEITKTLNDARVGRK